MAKLFDLALRLFKQLQAAQRERDKLASRTTKRPEPPTRRVEQGVRVEYSPDMDGAADPGEVVWAWVPYEEDATRGKDRPVVIIGRSADRLAGIPLTSKNKGRADAVAVGTGSWDSKGRNSWAKVDQLLVLDQGDIRREGAVLPAARFDDVVAGAAKYHDLIRR